MSNNRTVVILDAIEDYKKSLEIKPEGNVFGLCGCALMKLGYYKEAEEYLEKSVKMGWELYRSSLRIAQIASPELEEFSIKKAIRENLVRRREVKDEPINLSCDENKLFSGLENNLKIMGSLLKIDPDNSEIHRLFENAKMDLEIRQRSRNKK